MIEDHKKAGKIHISEKNKYEPSLSNYKFKNENDINNYKRKNIRNYFVVINPKAFLGNKKEDENNLINNDDNNKKKKLLLANSIKIGKLLRI